MCNGCSWLWVSGTVSRLSRHAPRPCYATCPRCTWCTLHLPLPCASCQDTVDPFGEFTSTFRPAKSRRGTSYEIYSPQIRWKLFV